MFERLAAILRPDLTLRRDLSALAERLAVLEAAQHPARLMEWVELREQLARYLARINAVEGKLRKAQQDDPAPADPVTIALLRAKYPKQNGG